MASSLISGALYHSDNHALELRFTNGRRYLYLGVPSSVAEGFREAESKGAFFNAMIKGRFDCHPLKDQTGAVRGNTGGGRSGRMPLRAALHRSVTTHRQPAND